MHDWGLSAERMAKVPADKGYHYQFVFARNSRHVASRRFATFRSPPSTG